MGCGFPGTLFGVRAKAGDPMHGLADLPAKILFEDR